MEELVDMHVSACGRYLCTDMQADTSNAPSPHQIGTKPFGETKLRGGECTIT